MITIISGTNRKNSKSILISRYYKDLLDEIVPESQIIDLHELPKDFLFSSLYENKGQNPDFSEFQEKIDESDKFVFIVPEYNGSFPGVLKGFIDGLKFPESFKGKKAAIVGISSGTQGGSLAMSHLVDILNYLGMHVLARRPRITELASNFSNGVFLDNYYPKMLKEQVKELISF